MPVNLHSMHGFLILLGGILLGMLLVPLWNKTVAVSVPMLTAAA